MDKPDMEKVTDPELLKNAIAALDQVLEKLHRMRALAVRAALPATGMLERALIDRRLKRLLAETDAIYKALPRREIAYFCRLYEASPLSNMIVLDAKSGKFYFPGLRQQH